MAKIIEQGFDEYEKELREITKAKRNFAINVNSMEYAAPLHDKHGYWVFNNKLFARVVKKWDNKRIKRGLPPTRRNIELSLISACEDYRNILRDTGVKMQPPVKKGEGPRAAHPGNWADITGNLASAYWYIVNGKPYGQQDVKILE